MKNKKLAAALLVPFMAASIGIAKAGECESCDSATQVLNATLCEYTKICADGGKTNVNIDCDCGNLTSALTPKFKVETNCPQTIYLKAYVKDSANAYVPAFHKNGSNVFLALGNTKTKPTLSAVNNCIDGSPSSSHNANAIAYQVSSVHGTNSCADTFNSSHERYDIKVHTGKTDITLTTLSAARGGTYAVSNDTAGCYSANLTLSSSAI